MKNGGIVGKAPLGKLEFLNIPQLFGLNAKAAIGRWQAVRRLDIVSEVWESSIRGDQYPFTT